MDPYVKTIITLLYRRFPPTRLVFKTLLDNNEVKITIYYAANTSEPTQEVFCIFVIHLL